MSQPRNGWVIRNDGVQQEERAFWAAGTYSENLHDAVFFATEADATKVSKLLPELTALDFVHDPRPEHPQTTLHKKMFSRELPQTDEPSRQ